MTRHTRIVCTFVVLVLAVLSACDGPRLFEPESPSSDKDGHTWGEGFGPGCGDLPIDLSYFDQPVWIGIDAAGIEDTVYHADPTCNILAQFPERRKFDHYVDYAQYWMQSHNYDRSSWTLKCETCSADFGPRVITTNP